MKLIKTMIAVASLVAVTGQLEAKRLEAVGTGKCMYYDTAFDGRLDWKNCNDVNVTNTFSTPIAGSILYIGDNIIFGWDDHSLSVESWATYSQAPGLTRPFDYLTLEEENGQLFLAAIAIGTLDEVPCVRRVRGVVEMIDTLRPSQFHPPHFMDSGCQPVRLID